MEKTLSQKIARVFSIINVVLLIPTTLFELYWVGLGLSVIFNQSDFGIPWLLLPILTPYVLGGLLLFGYFKCANGKLSKSSSILLWLGTFFFNAVPILILLSGLSKASSEKLSLDKATGIIFWNALIFFAAVVAAAFVALKDEIQNLNDVNPPLSIVSKI